jgi:glyoxylase-like metal-dependent hydrolase (beta-lactamase superfamily II)/rhodanese-related sulfurtransferase
MHFERIYLGCLAQASYLIGDGGRAVVVDPRRDVDEYLDKARQLELAIEHVVATHVHADFVAGLRELAARTGATVHMGRAFDGPMPCSRLGDGDELRVGNVRLRTLETPGHTPDSISLLVTDAKGGAPPRLCSGDTLFLGDVGRPDLVAARGLAPERMAGLLYDSLREKLMPLVDDVEVFPGHGAGSACGKNISNEPCSTLGRQRVENWALQDLSRDEFVRQLVADLAPPPAYFAHAAALNRNGPRLASELPPVGPLAGKALADAAASAIVLDVRSAASHGQGHVRGALNVGLGGSFETWCGTLIEAERAIVLLVGDEALARDARMRLSRIGLEDVRGQATLDAARQAGLAVATLPQISVQELDARLRRGPGWQVVDVRAPAEFAGGHVPGAVPAPLPRLRADGASQLARLDRDAETAVICAGGYRSSAATWILRELGFTRLHNVTGGTNAWVAAGLGVEK